MHGRSRTNAPKHRSTSNREVLVCTIELLSTIILKMTARRSNIPYRPLHENESSSSSDGFGCDSSEKLVRKYLFAPPVVAQNEIFREKETARNHFRHDHMYQQRSCASHDRRWSDTRNELVRRTGNEEYCGLSAEIALEIINRRPTKERAAIPRKKSFVRRKVGGLVPSILRRSQIEYVGVCSYKE
jgi:hypothetical protein